MKLCDPAASVSLENVPENANADDAGSRGGNPPLKLPSTIANDEKKFAPPWICAPDSQGARISAWKVDTVFSGLTTNCILRPSGVVPAHWPGTCARSVELLTMTKATAPRIDSTVR